ncbi:hypothetical protein [Paracidovorax oryzae]|uniref:hypothetical protein n=1 Tax=Paracidovorax oryzae TaxID=862720 RepID=UPI0035CEB02E
MTVMAFTPEQMEHASLEEAQRWIVQVARRWFRLEAQEFPDEEALTPEQVTACLYMVHRAGRLAGLEDGAALILIGFDALRAMHCGIDGNLGEMIDFCVRMARGGNMALAHASVERALALARPGPP